MVANIDLTAPVAAENLNRYGAGLGQMDLAPQGLVVFGKAGAKLTSGSTVHVSADGTIAMSSSAGAISGTILCGAEVGEGVWVLVLGNAGDEFVVPSVGAAVGS